MLLSDYLEDTGKTKTGLAKELGISKPALSKWTDIPERWMVVLFPHENKKPGSDYSLDEIRALCKMRNDKTDEQIAESAGLAFHEFRGMIQRLWQHGFDKGLKEVVKMKKAGTWPPPSAGNLES